MKDEEQLGEISVREFNSLLERLISKIPYQKDEV